jgi:hypothetical protein
MRTGILVVLLVLCAASVGAQRRVTSHMAVSARVVRSCRVATTGNAAAPVTLTCSRGATPGVLTSVSPQIVRIPPSAPTSLARDTLTTATTPNPQALPRANGLDVVEPLAETAPKATQPAIEVVTINF